MRKLLLGSALAFACVAPASANVVLLDKLSGTGDNVVFDSLAGSLAVGKFNGKNQGLVDFTDLSGNSLFTGATSGNDIKIQNTSDLSIVVKDNTNTSVLDTSEQVFSLNGTGKVTATVIADEPGGGTKIFTFALGKLSLTKPANFTLDAVNGESMASLVLLDVGGIITDFEHYRVDVASAVAATPLPAALPLFAGGLGLMGWLSRRRKRS